MHDQCRIKTFEEFWSFYLGEHRHPVNRMLHYVGTISGVLLFLTALVSQSWYAIIAAPIVAYSFAWTGHLLFEKNRPATFKYPLWSFLADFKMLAMFATGRLDVS